MKGLKNMKNDLMKRRDWLSKAIFMSFMTFMVQSSASTQQKPPVFRARIDLMQLDVTVLDKKGVPVRGLTQADFTLLEDDKPQSIQAFTAVDVPERTVTGPAWEKRVTPDVTSNQIDNSRIFVLVLDDGLGVGCCTELNEAIPRGGITPPARQIPNPWAVRELKKTTELFIDTLGPNDLAAVVFTGATYKSNQSLTQDRNKLLKAVQAYPVNDGTLFLDPGTPPSGPGGPPVKPIPQCLAAKQIVRMVDSVVTNLATVPDRRKSILYFGGSMPWGKAGDQCGTYWMWQDVFTRAQQGHVTINPVQTSGMMGYKNSPANPVGAWTDQYLVVADNTGGHAVVNTNDFAPGIRQIVLENSSYYLLAYQPTRDVTDGTFRRITVKVNRPDLEVKTRRSYWAPRETPPNRPAPEPPPPQVEAMAGILPDSKLALRVTAAPFAVPGADGAVVTLAIGVRQPAFAARTPEQVDLLVKAFMADGDAKATETQTIPITVPAAPPESDVTRYEVLARIEVPKPGGYELRLSAHSEASDTRGSVYVDVDVPDFGKEKLSLSGVVLNNALPSAPVAPPRVLRDITPLAPTTERAFTAADIVTAYLRLYQGGTSTLAPVTLKTHIQDAAEKSMFDKTESLAADRFATERAAEYQLRLPLATLTAGDYLLTFEATSGKVNVRRDVRFQVR